MGNTQLGLYYLLIVLATGSAACSEHETLSGDVLHERLLDFQYQLDEPLSSPFYGGISFDGKQETLTNLSIYLFDAARLEDTRSLLISIMGEGGKEVEIHIVGLGETIASEGLKSTVPVPSGAVSIDYDERIDRLRYGVEALEAVGELERTFQMLGIPREAVIIEADTRGVAY